MRKHTDKHIMREMQILRKVRFSDMLLGRIKAVKFEKMTDSEILDNKNPAMFFLLFDQQRFHLFCGCYFVHFIVGFCRILKVFFYFIYVFGQYRENQIIVENLYFTLQCHQTVATVIPLFDGSGCTERITASKRP